MKLTGTYFTVMLALLTLGAFAEATLSVFSKTNAGNATEAKGLRRRGTAFLVPEYATDVEWASALCRGKSLALAVKEADPISAQQFGEKTIQSPFLTFPDDFAKWGWAYYNALAIDPEIGDFGETGTGISTALKGIGVSGLIKDDAPDAPGFHLATVTHGSMWGEDSTRRGYKDVKGKPYTVDGKQYRYTEAYYTYGINAEEGMLLAFHLMGPSHTAPEIGKLEWPALWRASDIMFGLWKMHRGNEPLNTLRHILTVDVVNALTVRLIMYAMADGKTTELEDINNGWFNLRKWPGRFFELGPAENLNPAAIALLGSPVATSIAYMLIQHKKDLGDIRIIGVQVFKSEKHADQVNMLWILKGSAPLTPGKRPLPKPVWPVPKPPKAFQQGNEAWNISVLG